MHWIRTTNNGSDYRYNDQRTGTQKRAATRSRSRDNQGRDRQPVDPRYSAQGKYGNCNSDRHGQDDRHTGLPSNNRGFQRGNPYSDGRQRLDLRNSVQAWRSNDPSDPYEHNPHAVPFHQNEHCRDNRGFQQGNLVSNRSQFSGRYPDDRSQPYATESRRNQRGDAGSGYTRGQSDRQAENSARVHVGWTNGGSTDTRQPGREVQEIHNIATELSKLAKNNKNYRDNSETREYFFDLLHKLIRITPQATDYQMKNMTMANCLYALQLFPTNPSPKENNLINEILCLLTRQLTSATYPFNNIGISKALYGLQNMSSENQQVKDLLIVLAEKISRSGAVLKAQEIGNAFYGLQNMSFDCKEVRAVLVALTTKISHPDVVLDAQAIGSALYGLQNMSSDCKEVRAILVALTTKISHPGVVLDAQAIGNALYGLKNMSSKDQAVKDLLTVLTQKIANSRDELNGQAIGNALYGLKKMSSETQEVKDLLTVLTQKIFESDAVLTAQNISNALYGLQNMSSETQEVKDLLTVLTQKIFESDAVLTAQNIGNALYGLKNMSSKDQAVKDLLTVLTQKIANSRDELNGQAISNALYGLQNMSSETQQVRDLLNVLTPKIKDSKDELNAQNIGNALYGLKKMSSKHNEVKALLTVLAEKISNSKAVLNGQAIGNALYGLQNMSSDCEKVRAVLVALTQKIHHSNEKLKAEDIAMSLYGLRNMSSDCEEVRAVLVALTQKIHHSTEKLKAQQIAMSLYGLRKMSFDDIKPIVDWLCMQIPNMAINQVECFAMIQFLSAHRDYIAKFQPIVEKINEFCKNDHPSIRFLNTTVLTDHCKNGSTFESDLAKIHPLLKKGMDAESDSEYPIRPYAKAHLIQLFSTETLCQYLQKFDLANDDGSAADPMRNNLKSFGITRDDLLVGVIQKMDIGNLDDVSAVQETLENLHAHDRLPQNSIADRIFSLRMQELVIHPDESASRSPESAAASASHGPGSPESGSPESAASGFSPDYLELSIPIYQEIYAHLIQENHQFEIREIGKSTRNFQINATGIDNDPIQRSWGAADRGIIVYVPSRFTAPDVSLTDLLTSIFTQQSTTLRSGRLVIVCGHNRKQSDNQNQPGESREMFAQSLESEINSLLTSGIRSPIDWHVTVDVHRMEWDGIRFPFGAMRQALLTSGVLPAITQLQGEGFTYKNIVVMGIDGDITFSKGTFDRIINRLVPQPTGATTPAQSKQRPAAQSRTTQSHASRSPAPIFASIGFQFPKSNAKPSQKAIEFSQQALNLHYAIEASQVDAENTPVYRPNETCFAFTLSPGVIELFKRDEFYPKYDNECAHAQRGMRSVSAKQVVISQGQSTQKVWLHNNDRFLLPASDVRPQDLTDVINLYKTFIQQAQHAGSVNNIADRIAVITGLPKGLGMKIAAFFSWPNLVGELGFSMQNLDRFLSLFLDDIKYRYVSAESRDSVDPKDQEDPSASDRPALQPKTELIKSFPNHSLLASKFGEKIIEMINKKEPKERAVYWSQIKSALAIAISSIRGANNFMGYHYSQFSATVDRPSNEVLKNQISNYVARYFGDKVSGRHFSGIWQGRTGQLNEKYAHPAPVTAFLGKVTSDLRRSITRLKRLQSQAGANQRIEGVSVGTEPTVTQGPSHRQPMRAPLVETRPIGLHGSPTDSRLGHHPRTEDINQDVVMRDSEMAAVSHNLENPVQDPGQDHDMTDSDQSGDSDPINPPLKIQISFTGSKNKLLGELIDTVDLQTIGITASEKLNLHQKAALIARKAVELGSINPAKTVTSKELLFALIQMV